jgi:hypothetical protein
MEIPAPDARGVRRRLQLFLLGFIAPIAAALLIFGELLVYAETRRDD